MKSVRVRGCGAGPSCFVLVAAAALAWATIGCARKTADPVAQSDGPLPQTEEKLAHPRNARRLAAAPTPQAEEKLAHPRNARRLAAAPKPAPSGRLGGSHKASSRNMGRGEGRSFGMVGLIGSEQGITHNTEAYAHRAETGFARVTEHPLSTFSADVDTASYSNARRFLMERKLPPKDAVRIEEFLNYFSYDYPAPKDGKPFGVHTEVTRAPWNTAHKLVHIGIKTKDVKLDSVPPRNLVFLLDVSGSMRSPDKLPLLQQSMKLLVRQMREQDHVSIVVYAGAAGTVLEPTSGSHQGRILAALNELEAGGSTNGGAGIRSAYQLARKHFAKDGVNRVVLATDGDFNVGTTSEGELVRLIEEERKSGVFLTVLGLGGGNLKDSTMENLADKGNGNYAYLDSYQEAKKVLERESGATLVTVAKDVKFQVEFNPKRVAGYRLIGYENRRLAARDFNDDTKDAGELGAGHSVTALYEVVPTGRNVPGQDVDPLKYQELHEASDESGDELLTLKVRYKKPAETKSEKLIYTVNDSDKAPEQGSREHKWALSVASFGLLLSDSKSRGSASFKMARSLARSAVGSHPSRDEKEYLNLLERAAALR